MRVTRFSLLASVIVFVSCQEPIVPTDPANANLYQACNGGDGKSCVALGENYENGNRVGWQPERAIALYERACNSGYAEGCRHAGYFLEKPHALLQANCNRAARLLAKACDAGLLDTCTELATLYHIGPIRHDQRRAVRLYEHACEGGAAEACLGLGAMYRTGKGVKTDEKRAAAFYRLGCEYGGARACLCLGEHFFIGWGVPTDVITGKTFVSKACSLNDAMACAVLQPPEPTRSGSVNATKLAWKKLISAPRAADLFRVGVRSNREAIAALEQFRAGYERLDCRGADPELTAYVAEWKSWATDMITLCQRDQHQQQSASDVETFAGLLGATFEKNERGDRDGESLERGMAEGSAVGRNIAEVAGASARAQINAKGKALGERARRLADYQDVLALRLEMSYHVFLPPPKAKT